MSPIIGVMGSHSGYVTDPSDLYLRGNNPAGFGIGSFMGQGLEGSMSLESGMMRISNQSSNNTKGCALVTTNKAYNLSGYKRITLTLQCISGSSLMQIYIYLSTSRSAKYDHYKYIDATGTTTSQYSVSFDISSLDCTRYIGFSFVFAGTTTTYYAVYQIRLT